MEELAQREPLNIDKLSSEKPFAPLKIETTRPSRSSALLALAQSVRSRESESVKNVEEAAKVEQAAAHTKPPPLVGAVASTTVISGNEQGTACPSIVEVFRKMIDEHKLMLVVLIALAALVWRAFLQSVRFHRVAVKKGQSEGPPLMKYEAMALREEISKLSRELRDLRASSLTQDTSSGISICSLRDKESKVASPYSQHAETPSVEEGGSFERTFHPVSSARSQSRHRSLQSAL